MKNTVFIIKCKEMLGVRFNKRDAITFAGEQSLTHFGLSIEEWNESGIISRIWSRYKNGKWQIVEEGNASE